MNFTVAGRLAVKKETEKKTDTFSVREFVLEIPNERDARWNDFVLFQLTNNQCSLLDNVNVNDNINVTFDLRGRKWTNPEGRDMYFNTLSAWRIDPAQSGMPQQPAFQQPSSQAQPFAQPMGDRKSTRLNSSH